MNYLNKTPNDLGKIHSYFSRQGKEEMSVGQVSVFCENTGIAAYTLEKIILILKINFYLTMAVFLIINTRSRGNVSFTEQSEIITTPSNQDFAGLDKFRLLEKKNKCFYCKSVII